MDFEDDPELSFCGPESQVLGEMPKRHEERDVKFRDMQPKVKFLGFVPKEDE